jgi:DNA-binding response OmpR family regulator
MDEEKNKKVLIVEDDEGFRAILEKSFEGTEFLAIAVPDGETALEKAREEKPDLVLLDIMLPGIDGVQVAAKLKEEGNDVPVMFLTNVKDSAKISEAMMIKGGDVDYIVKTDIRIENIIERVRQRLGLK